MLYIMTRGRTSARCFCAVSLLCQARAARVGFSILNCRRLCFTS